MKWGSWEVPAPPAVTLAEVRKRLQQLLVTGVEDLLCLTTLQGALIGALRTSHCIETRFAGEGDLATWSRANSDLAKRITWPTFSDSPRLLQKMHTRLLESEWHRSLQSNPLVLCVTCFMQDFNNEHSKQPGRAPGEQSAGLWASDDQMHRSAVECSIAHAVHLNWRVQLSVLMHF